MPGAGVKARSRSQGTETESVPGAGGRSQGPEPESTENGPVSKHCPTSLSIYLFFIFYSITFTLSLCQLPFQFSLSVFFLIVSFHLSLSTPGDSESISFPALFIVECTNLYYILYI